MKEPLAQTTLFTFVMHLTLSIDKLPSSFVPCHLQGSHQHLIQLFIDGNVLLSQEGTTQDDPLAMAMYAIPIAPLIHCLENKHIKQIWFAVDVTAGGDLYYSRFGGIPSLELVQTFTWLLPKCHQDMAGSKGRIPSGSKGDLSENWCFHHCQRKKTP